MADDIEEHGRAPVASTPAEVDRDEGLEEERGAEHALVLAILKDVAICVPVAIPVCVGLVALALRNQHPSWAAWLLMGSGIGVLVGVFFGVWVAFVTKAHLLDEVEEHVSHGHQ